MAFLWTRRSEKRAAGPITKLISHGHRIAGNGRLRGSKTAPPRPTVQRHANDRRVGYGRNTDQQLSRAAGFDEHLIKPVDLERLNRLLSEKVRLKRGTK
jgi:hypothetical protein